jgi:hypothetical protein
MKKIKSINWNNWDEKELKILDRVSSEIQKIENKENNIYFFVIDSKGTPSGELEYIYKIALYLKTIGYNVTMLHQEENFVGVKDWLGEEYANIQHENISNGNVNVGVSDLLIIPELFATVMNQTKKLPCKRIALLQNLNYVSEFTPLSVQWGDYGIMECIANSKQLAEKIKEWFPYVKTSVINPYIDTTLFHNTIEPKKLIINIVAKNQTNINKIIKPFYWKYAIYKWVSFKDLRGLSQEEFASALREAAVTIWIDEDTHFGYTALEAMQSGAIIIAKIPEIIPEWAKKDDTNLKNSCIWFENYDDVSKIIANVVRGLTTDNVPTELFDESKKTLENYTKEKTESEITSVFANIFSNRKSELENFINNIKDKITDNDGNDK